MDTLLSVNLMWLKTVSNTFRDFSTSMSHYNHSLSVDAATMVAGENAVVIFVTQ